MATEQIVSTEAKSLTKRPDSISIPPPLYVSPDDRRNAQRDLESAALEYVGFLNGVVKAYANNKMRREQALSSVMDQMTRKFMDAYRIGMVMAGSPGSPKQTLASLPNWQVDEIAALVREEIGYFTKFLRDIRSTEAPMSATNRVNLYAGTLYSAFWRGWLSSLPPGAKIYWRRTVAESCMSCISLALANPYSLPGTDEDNPLPTVPRNGDTRCVIDPSARVLTKRGLVPIADVAVGDHVLTHRNRWRRVMNVSHSVAGQDRYARTVTGTNPFAVTSDHPILTEAGWVAADVIGTCQLPLYTVEHVQLSKVQSVDPFGLPIRTLHELRSRLSDMRRRERSSGARMHLVWPESQSQAPVEGASWRDTGWYSRISQATSHHVRSAIDRLIHVCQIGWKAIRALLGWRPYSVCLPIALGVGTGSRSDASRDCHPSQGRRPIERQVEESGVDGGGRPQSSSSQSSRSQLHGPQGEEPIDNVHVRTMRKEIRSVLARQGEAATVLPNRVLLDPSTRTYDLTIDEDHSFICEGVILHNCLTQCKCYLEMMYPFFSGLRNRVGLEIYAIAGIEVDPSAPSSIAISQMYQDIVEEFVWFTRLAQLDPLYYEPLADRALRELNTRAALLTHRYRLNLGMAEILEPTSIAIGAGYRWIDPKKFTSRDFLDDLVDAVAVVIAMNDADRGVITGVNQSPPSVEIDGSREYRLDVVGKNILFVVE